MKTRDFSFDLPEELIAQFPADRREASRLMRLDRNSGSVSHRAMVELPGLLPEGALLVINDSRVRKARIFAQAPSGASREFLFLRPAMQTDVLNAGTLPPDDDGETWMVMTRKPSRLNIDSILPLPGELVSTVVGYSSQFVYLRFEKPVPESYFDEHGHVPLPPYIHREDQRLDSDRYQTVYAQEPGSVAAPTAGLHLTEALINDIRDRGISIARVTLHVGLGTFLPVRVEDIHDHEMHTEQYEVGQETSDMVKAAMGEGRPVIAVGTTSVRTLESAWDGEAGVVRPGKSSTELFITPGYRFRVVSGLLTNFHTPESTLLMLVCAFAGTHPVLAAYREAVRERYRFFSYGDGMLIL